MALDEARDLALGDPMATPLEYVDLVEAAGLPEVVKAFIPEHHGTTYITYFLSRACGSEPDGGVDPADFRYPGPRPQSAESPTGEADRQAPASGPAVEALALQAKGNIPNATYCHPEVASIGMTEAQVKEKKIDYKVGKFMFSYNGRARTSGETEGFVKIIRDSKYGEILGAHIIGAHATELIHELAVARENEYTVEEIDLAIHAHPTLSEAIAQAGLDSMGRAIDI